MAEPTQYSFDLREVTEALIRKQGLKEGKWLVSFEFNLGAGVLGQSQDEARPGAFARVVRLQLTQPAPHDPELPWVVDAAELKG
jgi:hypothetical protein